MKVNKDEIVNILIGNKEIANKKVNEVKEILADLVLDLFSKVNNKNSKIVLLDKKGKVIGKFCYYHKKWELLSECEYGEKASIKDGYNSMCKEGVNLWYRRNKDYKRKSGDLLNLFMRGKIESEDFKKRSKEIEKENVLIIDRDDGKGIEDFEKFKEYVKTKGIEI